MRGGGFDDLTGDERRKLQGNRSAPPEPLPSKVAKRLEEAAASNGTVSAADSPAAALSAAAVDLVAVIDGGIPEREYVPGGDPWLIRGKRYLFPASAGVGKSLAALIIGVDVVESGGTVAILDVENGQEEYARRLADVLDDRDQEGDDLASACSDRLRYFAWPILKMTWGADEWADAMKGVDLVVFDSSRLLLSANGLNEDSSDDYADFVNALLVPLSRTGITTAVLDNTGHEGEHARGTKAKEDLNEVTYRVKVGQPFDRNQEGHVTFEKGRTRFSDLPAEMWVPIGGGTYGPVEEAEASTDNSSWRPTFLMERISEAIEQQPGLSLNGVRQEVKGKNDAKGVALRLLADPAEGYIRVEQDKRGKRHYSIRPYRESEDPKAGSE